MPTSPKLSSRRPFASPFNLDFDLNIDDAVLPLDRAPGGGHVRGVVRQVKHWWTAHRRKPGLSRRSRPLYCSKRVLLGLVLLGLVLFAIFRRRSTLVLSRDEVAKVWQWELASGRYPSRRPSRWAMQELRIRVENPGLPTSEGGLDGVHGVGHPRRYLRLPSRPVRDAANSNPPPPPFPYPPRPAPNSAIDLDVVMDHCDFSTNKYVRDCLHVLRINAGMDEGVRVDQRDLRHSFLPDGEPGSVPGGSPTEREHTIVDFATRDMSSLLAINDTIFAALVDIRTREELSAPISFPTAPPTPRHPSHPTADPACDPAQPRIFHIYWAGPFTDKPYVAALSFLYTQRLGLSLPVDAPPLEGVCRPQLWFWINPGPASSSVDEHAVRKMKETLIANEWSAPLLDRRFHDAIHFKLWNSTEQLNAIPEMKGWDSMGFFKSGGVKYKAAAKKSSGPAGSLEPREKSTPEARQTLNEGKPAEIGEDELSRFGRAAPVVGVAPEAVSHGEPAPTKMSPEEELFNRVGSAAESDYDRLSVILSDMARFVLTYRYGGVYLDADTLFLRDWEEIWGWHGAFGYRWSRLKVYNTAVLKMARGSALGSAIIKTAFRNGLDFHPMVVSRYLKEMRMEELLLRLPDALFDPAWLNVENYQRDRPAFPLFQSFKDFFLPPVETSAVPSAVGMVGFFRGAFSYHFHNYWWLPFDPLRNFPDLGPRFLVQAHNFPISLASEGDLSWATVLKRTFEKFLRGEAPNLYGEMLNWEGEGGSLGSS